MSCYAFEGAAGCGKTYRLLESARDAIQRSPLQEGQRLLATAYMHGARRKLDRALRELPGLRGRYECSTLDSVALRWTQRWRSLCAELGHAMPGDGEFDATCDLAAQLLAIDNVSRWVAAAFPLVLIDEAQDLTASRLAIVRALSAHSHVFVAGDEFQCLQEAIRPNPFDVWAKSGLNTETLTRVRRTDKLDLLSAAEALRGGRAPLGGRNFQIREAPSPALAGGHIVNAIAWLAKTGTVAVLAPSVPQYVVEAIEWATKKTSSKGHGPVPIKLERRDKDEAIDLFGKLDLGERAPIAVVDAALERLASPSVLTYLRAWVYRQRNSLGRTELGRSEVERAIDRALANRRQFCRDPGHRLSAMTVHAAKNREFDGVIVLWPYQVAGSADQKRRLLYNAITRAKKWALVLVQSPKILRASPFA